MTHRKEKRTGKNQLQERWILDVWLPAKPHDNQVTYKLYMQIKRKILALSSNYDNKN